MSNLQNKLNSLIKRNNDLKPLIFKSFETTEELNLYIDSKIQIFNEYKENQLKIEQLELELMTPEERKRHEKQMRFLALKAKGEPFDLDEFDDM
jgi:hypothetical protein